MGDRVEHKSREYACPKYQQLVQLRYVVRTFGGNEADGEVLKTWAMTKCSGQNQCGIKVGDIDDLPVYDWASCPAYCNLNSKGSL